MLPLMLKLKEFIMWGFLVAACLVLVYTKGHSDATNKLTMVHKTEQLAAVRQLEVERATTQEALAVESAKWQKHVAETESLAQGTIDRLTADGIRLRVKLADAIVSSVLSDGRREPDGTAELHEDTSRFLIEQAQRADAQVMGLQETVRILQGGTE